jgi:6-phosphogluconolactonase
VVDRLSPQVLLHADLLSAARATAARLIELSEGAVAAGRTFAVAVSGGKSPEQMFRTLASRSDEARGWKDWRVFWCDERCVPANDPRSNFGLAQRLWLGPAGVPRENVHPIDTSVRAEEGAERYEATLRSAFGSDPPTTFDAVVLGVGPDGHTASLFPGSTSLRTRSRWVVPEPKPRQPPAVPRVSLSLPGLARSRRALFLVGGADKADAMARILAPTGEASSRDALPAARVGAVEGVEWFLDRDAAPLP